MPAEAAIRTKTSSFRVQEKRKTMLDALHPPSAGGAIAWSDVYLACRRRSGRQLRRQMTYTF